MPKKRAALGHVNDLQQSVMRCYLAARSTDPDSRVTELLGEALKCLTDAAVELIDPESSKPKQKARRTAQQPADVQPLPPPAVRSNDRPVNASGL